MSRATILPILAAIVVAAASAALALAAPIATPKVPTPKLYDVRITSNLKTTWIDHGCGDACEDGYNGAQTRTLTVKGLRVTFKDKGFTLAGSIDVQGRKSGVETTTWDHRTRFCRPEKPVVKTLTSVQVLGGYALQGKKGLAGLRINSGPAGPPKGDPITCSSNVQIVPVAARIGGSLVGGQLTDSYLSLALKVATAAGGKLGFPLDRLTAGRGFTLTLSGKSVSNQEDVKLKKQETVTTGSVRIVFTPRARRAVATRRLASADTTCSKTYPGWWSKSKRACFLVTAKTAWRMKTSWTTDRNGAPCTGSDSLSMRWSSSPMSFWVGGTFPIGYSVEHLVRTSDFIGGPVKATLERRTSGGAYEFGCVAFLRKDCGPRQITFDEIRPQIVAAVGNETQLVVVPQTPATATAPYRGCGLTAQDLEVGPSPDFGGFVVVSTPWRRGVVGKLDDLFREKVLATPIGGRTVFRDSASAPDAGGLGGRTSSGIWTGVLTFTRVS